MCAPAAPRREPPPAPIAAPIQPKRQVDVFKGRKKKVKTSTGKLRNRGAARSDMVINNPNPAGVNSPSKSSGVYG
jgi:hypothetical protein